MADIRLLERTLAENVAWNRARINFVAKFLVALIQVRSVNLAEVASVFAGGALKESHYKRIQRFLRSFELPYAAVAAFVLKLLGVPAPWALTLDRTDWYLGQTPLNILVLGVVYQGTAFPVLWAVLPKKGCSSTAERIALLDEFGRQFGFSSVAYLCADREFIGKVWFSYLRRHQIACRIRIRANTRVTNGRGLPVEARRLFRQCRVGHSEALSGARVIWGERWHVSGLRLPKGEYVIVIAEREVSTALADYAQRWEVETLFGCLKTRGFCLEATHVTEPERLKKLLALVALAFCWAHVTGEWLSAQKPLPIKKHGRKAQSIFRLGLDHLRRILCNWGLFTSQKQRSAIPSRARTLRHDKPKLPGRRKRVTLIAAFRCPEGVIICADSQETVGTDWRSPVDKIRPHDAGEYQVVIGGSGNDGPLIDAFTKSLIRDISSWPGDIEEEAFGQAVRLSLANYLYNQADVKEGVRIGVEFIACIRRKADGKVFLWKLFGPEEDRGPIIMPVEGFALAGMDFPYVREVRRLYQGAGSALRCILLGVHLFVLARETSNYIGGPTQIIGVLKYRGRNAGTLDMYGYEIKTVWVEAPGRVREFEELMEGINRLTGELLLLCGDTTIDPYNFRDLLNRYTKQVEELRESYIGRIRAADESDLGVINPYHKIPLLLLEPILDREFRKYQQREQGAKKGEQPSNPETSEGE